MIEPHYDGYREKGKAIRLLNNYTGAWNNEKVKVGVDEEKKEDFLIYR